jgi:hypothetical protein
VILNFTGTPMTRLSQIAAMLTLAVSATLSHAHFLFIVPSGQSDARVILSETLNPDADVNVEVVSAAKLVARNADGTEAPLALGKLADGSAFSVVVPEATSVIYGIDDLGINSRGGKANWLIYYPKAIVGESLASPVLIGGATPVELVPAGAPGATTLQLLVDGKPKADASVTIILPDGTNRELKTAADGRTPALTQSGRYGAWARDWQDWPGEKEGKAYEQVRRYATLVFDVQGTPPLAVAATSQPAADAKAAESTHVSASAPHAIPAKTPLVRAEPLGVSLPEATSSFGAVALDGWLYVYGGHIAPTHEYSTAAVSNKFHRLDLYYGRKWIDLPAGPAVQGMNLVAHAGKIYRVGGMQPVNAPGTPADNRSLADVAAFNPATGKWESIPPLPEPRSSHDVAIVGDSLYVLGGWNLQGSAVEASAWPETMYALDLRTPGASWMAIPQPFKRRALIAAVLDGKLFAIGGFDSDNRPSRRVDVYDPKNQSWTRGPGLPGEAMNGFSPAACVQDNQLFVSVGDGGLYRFNVNENIWEPVGTSTPRIVHRLVPFGARILILGGATQGDNLDLIEAFSLQTLDQAPLQVSQIGTSTLSSKEKATVETQTHCPIMRDEEVNTKSFVVHYLGVPIRLCCASCVKRWISNPEKYADSAFLPQLRPLTAATPLAESGSTLGN